MQATKHQLEIIKVLAEKIKETLGEEVMTYNAIEKVPISHEDMKLSNQVFEEDKEYNMKIPVAYEVNHRRRLRKAFEKEGTEGIIKHMKKCGFEVNVKFLTTLMR